MIAVPGSHGTLQEMAVAVDLGKPVIAVGIHETEIPGVRYLSKFARGEHELSDAMHRSPRGWDQGRMPGVEGP